MDDLTKTTSMHVQARSILKALNDMTTWARMKFKPRRSRSMVIRNGEVTSKFQYQIQGDGLYHQLRKTKYMGSGMMPLSLA